MSTLAHFFASCPRGLEPVLVKELAALGAGRAADELADYPEAFRKSWLFDELWRARNFKQWMAKGLHLGTMMVGLEQWVLGGKFPWTLHHQHNDHEMLKPASACKPIEYPKPDGKISFDRLSSDQEDRNAA